MENSNVNGWNEWGKHVLTELDRLSISIESLIRTINESNSQIKTNTEWIRDHKTIHNDIHQRCEKHSEDIKDIKKTKYVFYGIIIAMSVFISGGLVAYIIKP